MGHFAGQFRFCSQILEKVRHMDVNTGSPRAAGAPGRANKLDGNTIHLLKADGTVATIVWCSVATIVILMVVKISMGLRVDEQTEVEGLDIRLHGEVVP